MQFTANISYVWWNPPSWWGPPLLARGWLASLTPTWSCWAARQKHNRSGPWWSAGRPRVWSMTGPASEQSAAAIYPAHTRATGGKWLRSRPDLDRVTTECSSTYENKTPQNNSPVCLPARTAVLERIKMLDPSSTKPRASYKTLLQFLPLITLLLSS